MRVWIGWVCVAALLAGCSSTPICERKQDYEGAREYATLKAPAGLTVPEADPTLQIPTLGPDAQRNAQTQQGKGCLETPPPLRENIVTPMPTPAPASQP